MKRTSDTWAWSILAMAFVATTGSLVLLPARTGVVHEYRMASIRWWASEPLYGVGPPTHGFLYFPTAAVLFSPFTWLPALAGGIMWRAVGWVIFSFGLFRLSRLALFRLSCPTDKAFRLLVLLAVPAALAALQNGQANLHLGGLFIHCAVDLWMGRYVRSVTLLVIAVALKPIALPLLLLSVAIFPPMRKPLVWLAPAFVLVGIAHPQTGYAIEEWRQCLFNLGRAVRPEQLRVSDLFGMLEKTGMGRLPSGIEMGLRLGAAVAALFIVAWTARRFRREVAVWGLWSAGTLFLMLFSPRTETNSYVLFSPVAALAALLQTYSPSGRRWAGACLGGICGGLMCDGMGKTIYLATDVWLKPLLAVASVPLLAWTGSLLEAPATKDGP